MKPPTIREKKRLRSHFGFSKIPFSKYMKASQMFDSTSQRDLKYGLDMWTEVKGFALVTGPTGVGKSITLRRFLQELPDTRYIVFDVSALPATVNGFLRLLSRKLALSMRQHTADFFDAAQKYLMSYEQEHGAHPILVLDDAEGLTPDVVDAIRRLTTYELDSQDRFSVLLSGIEGLLDVLQMRLLEPLKARFSFVQSLKPFGLEDTRNYIIFHLERADADPKLFTDDAMRRIFQASMGRPRSINQLAVQALIQTAVKGRDQIDGTFMKNLIAAHPLYQFQGTAE